MFTGIVTDVGTVRSAEQRGDLRLVIGTGYDMETVELGASIASLGFLLCCAPPKDAPNTAIIKSARVRRASCPVSPGLPRPLVQPLLITPSPPVWDHFDVAGQRPS